MQQQGSLTENLIKKDQRPDPNDPINKQTWNDYFQCIGLMFFTYGLVVLIYYLSSLAVKSNFNVSLGIFGGMFIVYLIVLSLLWAKGCKKAAQMEADMIQENLKLQGAIL